MAHPTTTVAADGSWGQVSSRRGGQAREEMAWDRWEGTCCSVWERREYSGGHILTCFGELKKVPKAGYNCNTASPLNLPLATLETEHAALSSLFPAFLLT